MGRHPVWEPFTLNELLFTLAVFLQWRSHGPAPGDVLKAKLDNYWFEFDRSTECFSVKRSYSDKEDNLIYMFKPSMPVVMEAITHARWWWWKEEFRIAHKSELEESVIYELDKLVVTWVDTGKAP